MSPRLSSMALALSGPGRPKRWPSALIIALLMWFIKADAFDLTTRADRQEADPRGANLLGADPQTSVGDRVEIPFSSLVDVELSDSSVEEREPAYTSQELCRYWEGYLTVSEYQLTTCGHCYGYIFQTSGLIANWTNLIAVIDTKWFPRGTIVIPDRHNASAVSAICQTLSDSSECARWLECCDAAEECCAHQRKAATSSAMTGHRRAADNSASRCPSTWDGFACWDETDASKVVRKECPTYIASFSVSAARDAFKNCTKDGSWYKKQQRRQEKEWTDYTNCLNINDINILKYVKIICNAVSLLVLAPSLGIFLAFRQLRNQDRIRIHMQMFVSFMFYALVTIIWQVFVVSNIGAGSGKSAIAASTVGCKFLNFLTRYTSTTNYMWVFCEGLYLHRLLAMAFQPPNKLLAYYLIGWGFPCVPVGIYSIIRLYNGNENCWIRHIGGFEFIIYTPNFIALLANLLLFIDILRILVTQIQTHPNEPSNFRRALKATFVLIPLFGLQLFLIIYRPPGYTWYEILAAVIINTQGFFVALIFCLLNGEVLSILRRTCLGGRYYFHTSHDVNHTKIGHVTHTPPLNHAGDRHNVNTAPLQGPAKPSSNYLDADTGPNSQVCIPLKPMGHSNGHVS